MLKLKSNQAQIEMLTMFQLLSIICYDVMRCDSKRFNRLRASV